MSKNKFSDRKNGGKKSGMVALLPAIILSGILLIMMVGASRTFLSMLWRTSLAENRSQSVVAVRSCLRRIVAKRIQNPAYVGGENLNIFQYQCTVKPFVAENMAQNISVSVVIGEAQSTDTATYNPETRVLSNEKIF